MMRAYLINLDRAPERREHMESQFNRLGVTFTRVEAVDAKLMSSQEVEAFRHSVAETWRPHVWSLAQIGNFLSHKKVWSEIASGSDGFAAVFEDDVHLSDRIAPLLKTECWNDGAIDIVRFETTEQSMKLARYPEFQKNGMKLFRVESGAWGTAGYLIRRDIAKWLDCAPCRVYEPTDWFMFHPKSAVTPAVRVFQLDPAPCIQDQYHPDLNQRRKFDKVTQDDFGVTAELSRVARRMLSPLARKVAGRRGIHFL